MRGTDKRYVMVDRNSKKKGAPVKDGANTKPETVAKLEAIKQANKNDTVEIETKPEAEKAEGEVKANEDKTDVVKMAPIHVVGGQTDTEANEGEKNKESAVQVDPELELIKQRESRKADLTLLYNDNPLLVLTSPSLTEEDKILIGEIAEEQNKTIRSWAAYANDVEKEKDAVERKLEATNSKLGNVTALISNTVTQTVGQVEAGTAAAIEGLKTTVVEHLGKQNGFKSHVTTMGDQISENIRSLKGRLDGIKSVEGKVDGVGAMLGEIDKKISDIKPSASSHWAWVTVIGFLLLAVTVIAVFLLNKDVEIKVEVQQAPAGNTMKIVPPVLSDEAVGATSQQATPGGPSNLLVPTVGATPADPCEGKVGKDNGECAMNSRRPTDFPDQDWNTVLTVFAEPVSVALEGGGMEACREKFLRATGDDDKALECQAAVKCLVSVEEKRRDCWRIATESFGTKLGMTN